MTDKSTLNNKDFYQERSGSNLQTGATSYQTEQIRSSNPDDYAARASTKVGKGQLRRLGQNTIHGIKDVPLGKGPLAQTEGVIENQNLRASFNNEQAFQKQTDQVKNQSQPSPTKNIYGVMPVVSERNKQTMHGTESDDLERDSRVIQEESDFEMDLMPNLGASAKYAKNTALSGLMAFAQAQSPNHNRNKEVDIDQLNPDSTDEKKKQSLSSFKNKRQKKQILFEPAIDGTGQEQAEEDETNKPDDFDFLKVSPRQNKSRLSQKDIENQMIVNSELADIEANKNSAMSTNIWNTAKHLDEVPDLSAIDEPKENMSQPSVNQPDASQVNLIKVNVSQAKVTQTKVEILKEEKKDIPNESNQDVSQANGDQSTVSKTNLSSTNVTQTKVVDISKREISQAQAINVDPEVKTEKNVVKTESLSRRKILLISIFMLINIGAFVGLFFWFSRTSAEDKQQEFFKQLEEDNMKQDKQDSDIGVQDNSLTQVDDNSTDQKFDDTGLKPNDQKQEETVEQQDEENLDNSQDQNLDPQESNQQQSSQNPVQQQARRDFSKEEYSDLKPFPKTIFDFAPYVKPYPSLIDPYLTVFRLRGDLPAFNFKKAPADFVHEEDRFFIKLNEQYAIYDGEVLGTKKDGRGTELNFNGNFYEGFWKNNLKHGTGRLYLPNGDYYEGGFKEDKANGYGVYTNTGGQRLQGQWVDNRFIQ